MQTSWPTLRKSECVVRLLGIVALYSRIWNFGALSFSSATFILTMMKPDLPPPSVAITGTSYSFWVSRSSFFFVIIVPGKWYNLFQCQQKLINLHLHFIYFSKIQTLSSDGWIWNMSQKIYLKCFTQHRHLRANNQGIKKWTKIKIIK